MQRLLITIVRPALEAEADIKFRRWCSAHPSLMAIAQDDMFLVSQIRGAKDDGAVVGKRQYRLALDDSLAELLVADEDWVLGIVVVEAKASAKADHEFFAWWDGHPGLRTLLGQRGFSVEDIGDTVQAGAGHHLRQYRISLRQADAALLVPGAQEKR